MRLFISSLIVGVLIATSAYAQKIVAVDDNVACVQDDTPFEIDLKAEAASIPSDAGGNGRRWAISSISPTTTYAFSAETNNGAHLKINNVSDYTTVTVSLYYVKSDGTTQTGSIDYETFNIQVLPGNLSARYTNTTFLLSTGNSIDLNDYFNVPSGANTSFSVNTSDPVLSGTGNKDFDPSQVTSFNNDITVTCLAYYGGSSYCKREATTTIKVGDGNSTLPFFIRPFDQLPICKKDNLFQLQALSGCVGNMTIQLDYDDNGTYETSSTITIGSLANLPAQDGFTGSYLYNFNIDPTLTATSVSSIGIRVVSNPPSYFYAPNKCTVSNNDISGKIPITPQPEVKVFGLPGYELGVSAGDDAYLCYASLDEITMTGLPTGGFFNIYKNGGINILKDGLDIGLNSATQQKKGSYKFVPNEIFLEPTLGNGDYTTFFKVVYNYPLNPVGSCPDSITFNLRFRRPNETTFSIASPTPYCDGNILNLNITGSNTGDEFKWEFWDKDDVVIDQSGRIDETTYLYQFPEPGRYKIRLKTFASDAILTSTDRCNNDVLLALDYGAKPVASFDVSGLELGTSSVFTGSDNLLRSNGQSIPGDEDNVIKWYWHWDAPLDTNITPALSEFEEQTIEQVTHTFNTLRNTTYRVVLITEAGWGCSDTISRFLPVFPVRTPNENNPILENFNTIDGATGFYHNGQYNQLRSLSSWENIIPDNKPFWQIERDNGVWATSKNLPSDTAGYFNYEQSWVESPYFDISQLERPAFRFDYICQSNVYFDGANVQYAFIEPGDIFGEEDWKVLGEKDKGNDWYNFESIVAEPGGSFLGWTGTADTLWHSASFILDDVRESLTDEHPAGTLVRFRIVFGANADNGPPFQFDGFAFDNFRVDERTRKVVIEEFNTQAYFNANAPDAVGVLDAADDQAAVIRYFVDYNNSDDADISQTDPLNAINKADPSSRALYYGINQIERAVIDGNVFENEVFGTWGPSAYDRHMLKIAPFKIDLNLSNVSGELVINRSVSRLEGLGLEDRPFVLHTAVVSDAGAITHVLRKMLPHAGGEYYASHNWDSDLLPEDVSYTPVTALTGTNTFTVICFLQDAVTKEIYQAEMESYSGVLNFADDASLVQGRVLNDGQLPLSVLYPQPADNRMTLEFSSPLQSDVTYSIRNSMGVEVSAGQIPKGNNEKVFHTMDLVSGFYTIVLTSSTDSSTQLFIKK